MPIKGQSSTPIDTWRERLRDKSSLFLIRPVTQLAARPQRFRRQNLKGPRVIHTVAHRILRMIHAENERSIACTLRGDAYALTIHPGSD
jgi:hypothetical protein